MARREANKRGFGPQSGKRIQIVTDGDNDLERYIKEFFPEAEHTLDVYHVVEYLWEAGACLYREGSAKLKEWVNAQKTALYEGRVVDIIAELGQRLQQLNPLSLGSWLTQGKEHAMKSRNRLLRMDALALNATRAEDRSPKFPKGCTAVSIWFSFFRHRLIRASPVGRFSALIVCPSSQKVTEFALLVTMMLGGEQGCRKVNLESLQWLVVGLPTA